MCPGRKSASPKTFPSPGDEMHEIFRNSDVMALIMGHITDINTLRNLNSTCLAARQVLQQCPGLIQSALCDLPGELRQAATAILILCDRLPHDLSVKAKFVTEYLGHTDAPASKLTRPVFALKDLATTLESVDYLTTAYVDSCMKRITNVDDLHKETNQWSYPLVHHDIWEDSIHEDERCLYHEEEQRETENHLSGLPQRWNLPLAPSELHRTQRAFLRLEIFRRLFPDSLSLSSGNDPSIILARRNFIARFQSFEIDELFCVSRYCYSILDKVYRPTSDSALRTHYQKSFQQWVAFADRTFGEEDFITGPPRASLDAYLANENNSYHPGWFRGRYHAKSGYGDFDWWANSSHQKWILHLMSRGLAHIHRCHAQTVRDGGRTIPKHHPRRRYYPKQFLRAPIETLCKWGMPDDDFTRGWQFHMPLGAEGDFYGAIKRHARKWPDTPEADRPGRFWRLFLSGNEEAVVREGEVGYLVWGVGESSVGREEEEEHGWRSMLRVLRIFDHDTPYPD